jgi:hypothetical protein
MHHTMTHSDCTDRMSSDDQDTRVMMQKFLNDLFGVCKKI